jgi:hypothetical protein
LQVIFLIFLLVFGAYAYLIYRLSRAIFRSTGRRSLQVAAFAVLLLAPLYDYIIGYFVFEDFSREHPGIPVTETHVVGSVLVTGRKIPSPREALWRGVTFFKTYEYHRDDVAGMVPAPSQPLRAYVQFQQVDSSDSSCVERFSSASSSNGIEGCIGVTSSDAPVSEFEISRPPSLLDKRGEQLNRSSLFPIFGEHSFVREVKTGRVIAENWHMAYYVWWLDSPEMMVFSRHNPGGKESYESLIPSTTR